MVDLLKRSDWEGSGAGGRAQPAVGPRPLQDERRLALEDNFMELYEMELPNGLRYQMRAATKVQALAAVKPLRALCTAQEGHVPVVRVQHMQHHLT